MILKGLVRLPLLSYTEVLKLNKKGLKKFISENVNILDAILLSSNSSYNAIKNWLNGDVTDLKRIKKIEYTLYKYILRMSFRATPFGMFSSIGYVELDNNNNNNNYYKCDENYQSFFRLDACAIQSIIDFLNQNFKSDLKYRSNNTIYKIGNQTRYIEQTTKENIFNYNISAVESDEWLDNIIEYCSNYKSFAEIIDQFRDINEIELISYLNDLIDYGLLVSELNIALLHTDSLSFIIEKVMDLNEKELLDPLTNIEKCLTSNKITLHNKVYQINTYLEKFDIQIKLEDILYVDTYRGLENISINKEYINNIKECRIILEELYSSNRIFSYFIKEYKNRYGERAMPLLNVLDPEIGIGYQHKKDLIKEIELLKEIEFPSNNNINNIYLNDCDIALLKILQENKNSRKIELKSATKKNSKNYSNCVLFSLCDDYIVIDGFYSSSGTSFLSRFSYINNSISELCKTIVKKEYLTNTIIAEVIHCQEAKTANLIRTNSLRSHEIFCYYETNNKENIKLSDLEIRIIDNKIQLFSKKFNQEILPRLSSTINYDRKSINIFKFLGDLQFQNSSQVSFTWGNLIKIFSFFPRITFKNVILSPSIWIVTKSEITDNIKLWQKTNNVPNYIYIYKQYKDDYKLFIDLNNKDLVDILIDEIKKEDQLFVEEAFITNYIYNSKGNYLNEFVLPLIINDDHNTKHNEEYDSDDKFHIPGDKWIYFKIYCGAQNTDNIIAYIFEYIIKSIGNIDKWFFIKYSDEQGDHLRLRLHGDLSYDQTLNNFQFYFHEKINEGIISNVMLDSYKPEINRYGSKTIELCEEIFMHDSIAIVSLLSKELSSLDKAKLAFLNIEYLLNDFNLNINEKIHLMNFLKDEFLDEFSFKKKHKIQLDKVYRKYRSIISDSLNLKSQDEFNKRTKHIASLVKEISEKLSPTKYIDVVTSIIHMSINRLLTSNHRKQELIFYYMLSKHYTSFSKMEQNAD